MTDTDKNDKLKKISEIFEEFSKKNEETDIKFISTEAWVAQLGKRFTS